MNTPPTPRRLLTLDALFVRCVQSQAGADAAQDTGMPGAAGAQMRPVLASAHPGRVTAEAALQEGGRRDYAARDESQLLERRRRVG